MAARSETIVLPKKAAPDETVPESTGQRRPVMERYRLMVDRQTKASFDTSKAAETAGLAIKTAHPLVQVMVYDALEYGTQAIELPKVAK
jgi:hypothetical protein